VFFYRVCLMLRKGGDMWNTGEFAWAFGELRKGAVILPSYLKAMYSIVSSTKFRSAGVQCSYAISTPSRSCAGQFLCLCYLGQKLTMAGVPIPAYKQFWTDKRSSLKNDDKELITKYPEAAPSLQQLYKVLCDRESRQIYSSIGWGKRGVGYHFQLCRGQ
jgi:hypothetical protein